MKMNITATEAYAITLEAEKQEHSRNIRVAENAIAEIFEPQIELAAKAGKRALSFYFREEMSKVYIIVRAILVENGFKARIASTESVLHIEWWRRRERKFPLEFRC